MPNVTRVTLSAQARQRLHDWPVNERRNAWVGRRLLGRVSLGKAIELGLLCPVDGNAYKRTDRPVTLAVRRGPRATYQGDFPWSVAEHWRRLETSPARIAERTAAKLGQHGSRFDWVRVARTRGELVHLRRCIPLMLREQPARWLPEPMRWLWLTASGRRVLYAGLLVDPVYENDRWVRFQALDPDVAWQTIQEQCDGSQT